MFSNIFHAIAYDPIYNFLVFLVDIIPGGSVGVAVILATVVVKIILFPLSLSAVRTQMVLKTVQPKIKEVQDRLKDKKEEMAKELMALYKKYKINPFSSLLLFIIQIPIIIALYLVFLREAFPVINTDILYSFVPIPELINLDFFGFITVTDRSIVLALLAGITQFFQVRFAMPAPGPRKKDATMKEDMVRNLQLQLRFMMPVLITIFAYMISAVVALYFITSNLFAIGQELYMRQTVKKEKKEEEIATAEVKEV
ncbi:membrane protein insertase YidC [Candidatus Wolfebacteria bacterium]|nr:membrane protein insertase YidC [Candidatus Wolfebacteria bacterium]